MPLSLPKKSAKMSNYSLSQNSVLSDQELSSRSRKDKELFRLIREARSDLSKLDNMKHIEVISQVRFIMFYLPQIQILEELLISQLFYRHWRILN
jgi:hypothetical protein